MLTKFFAGILLVVAAGTAAAQLFAPEGLLEPEKAFRISARALDERTAEVEFKIADGYYMYRDRFSFATESGKPLAEVEIPRGKVKEDQFFGKTETFRDLVKIRVPLSPEDAAKGSVNLKVTSQGCSDKGVCYTPLEQLVRVSLPGAGSASFSRSMPGLPQVPWAPLVAALAAGLALVWASAGAPLRREARRDAAAADREVAPMNHAWPAARIAWALLGALALAAGAIGAYLSLRPAATSEPAPQSGFVFRTHGAPRPMPEVVFADGEGTGRTLAGFRSRVVLLNVWAPWCAPCREEMPALDRLQQKLGGPGFEVVALSIDAGGAPAVKQFYDEIGIRSLAIYVDRSMRTTATLGIVGLPTTLLVDTEGREIGRHIGPAQWDAPEAVRMIAGYMK